MIDRSSQRYGSKNSPIQFTYILTTVKNLEGRKEERIIFHASRKFRVVTSSSGLHHIETLPRLSSRAMGKTSKSKSKKKAQPMVDTSKCPPSCFKEAKSSQTNQELKAFQSLMEDVDVAEGYAGSDMVEVNERSLGDDGRLERFAAADDLRFTASHRPRAPPADPFSDEPQREAPEAGPDVTFRMVWEPRTRNLDEPTKRAVYSIFLTNMLEMYKASTNLAADFNRDEKVAEIFDPIEGRYILVESDDGLVAGYVHLRFCLDRDCDDEDDVDGQETEPTPCLYVYEIQVAREFEGYGIGRRLMRICEVMAKEMVGTKVVLTVFKSNLGAIRFYDKLGFMADINNDPTIYEWKKGADKENISDESEFDYFILCKSVKDGGAVSCDASGFVKKWLEKFKYAV